MSDVSDQRVFLKGHIDVPPDRLEAVRAALPLHISLTRAEEGCISFEVVEDQATPGRFMVSEVFATQAAFDAHQARAKASDWFQVTQGIPRNYTIETAEDRAR
ncbi:MULTISPECIES: putative quinol monooxygenase [unclassified Ruegeria]|uniref:putative quinol monooxygenase n=1 Tax=unclassified Ruegeria TaxID=2625375 RepID=UPI00148924FB|nr:MULTISPECIES: putative quinol monooxygenase [unclassified Ruegeria]NOD77979.1 antibiotic biosynthesis monooxygenase [Ruegeria sp. HKCCD4332]NOD87563.1 antibiotic biosynthesis monooxygenase [Ruegeria sp. HKCCD4318]NOE15596.1 antibiotic biosynthesis monooxygenase [Ruegeria sp. HKCCD4318-2]NOG08713.1 antibiotic biosynthesis monooxygenase [Ruegeria sp. HKCCD4315]